MRILLLSNLYPPDVEGGAEILAGEIAAGLIRQGHEVYVLTSSPRGGDVLRAPDQYIQRTLRLAGPVRVDHRRALWRQLDLPIHYYRRFHQPASALELRRVVAMVQPDVLYCWEITGLGVISLLQALPELRLPVVFHLGSYWLLYARSPETEESRLRARWLKRWLIGAVPALTWTSAIAVSEALKGAYVGAGFDSQRIEVIHNGAGPRFVETPPPAREEHPATPVRLLFVGRLCREKGVMTALRALDRLTRETKRVTGAARYALDIAGDGDVAYAGELRAFADQAGLGDRVVFHGRVPQEKLIDLYDRADMLLNTSLWEEPFGLTTVEAMARGLPVIATRVGATPEIVVPDATGLLVAPGDEQALAGAIARLAADPARRDHLSAAARRLVEERFTMETNSERVARHLYRAVAGEAAASAADARESIRGGRRASS